MKKYKMIQVKEETHTLLQKYCNEHGCSISWLVNHMINEKIGKPVPILKNVLRVKT